MKKGFTYCFLILAFFSCKKEENGVCLKGIGNHSSETRTIGNIHYLDATDRFEIVYHQDSLFKIDISGGENLLPGIVTETIGDTLYLRNGNACDWYRKYNHKIYVHIHLPGLRHVRYSGSGTFTTNNQITGNYFAVEAWDSGGDILLNTNVDSLSVANHAGTADFYLTGYANKFWSYMGGNGFIHAQNLNSIDAFVNNSGTGDISVRASNFMEIQVFYIGDIIYYGHPVTLDIRLYDSGRAIPGD